MCGLSCLEFIRRWRLWIRPAAVVAYIFMLCLLIPLLIGIAIEDHLNQSQIADIIGGVLVLLIVPISLWEIVQHLVYYHKPFLQKHIIRILWMVPIYALNAWLGLLFADSRIYMDSIRECYEAYVIYNFMVFILNYLDSETNLVASLKMKPQIHHFFPLCFLPPWEMGRDFVHMCKHGILQYTVVRPISSAISFICELNDVYGEGDFKATVAYPYLIFVNNLSQFMAMYCLVLFYRANREELRPMKPIGKFLCIKSVVFFSFFQGVIIAILVYTEVISSTFGNEKSPKLIASKLQDFLICIEMFIAAVAHRYCFSHKPYIPATEENWSTQQLGCWEAFTAMWDISDVHRDLREHIGVVGSSLSRTIRGQNGYKALPTENSGLLRAVEEIDATSRDYSSVSTVSKGSTTSESIDPRQHPRRRSIDKTATEAANFVTDQELPVTGRGIPVFSPDERLIDLAPEVDVPPGGHPPIA